MHASSVLTSHHPKLRELHKMGWEDHKHQRLEKRDVKCSLLDTTWLCIHGVTAAVVTGTRPIQDQASQHSNLDWEGPKAQFLVKEVLAVDGAWEKKSQTSFEDTAAHVPRDGYTLVWIWRALIWLRVINNNSNKKRTWSWKRTSEGGNRVWCWKVGVIDGCNQIRCINVWHFQKINYYLKTIK